MNSCSTNNSQQKTQDLGIAESLGKIKNKIFVMSGKGGVGKSSMAVNIAMGLANKGYKTGLMDVDLHGPSVPQMLGLKEEKLETIDEKIIPIAYSDNLSVISIESMLDSIDKAVIWRGPLKIGVIRQFISDVKWGNLDYLVIDSPPGTGDEPLTVAQTIKDAKAVVVTTPQNVSIRDVRKSINFCGQVNMNILGLIENMSGFVCPSCGENIDLFKTDGGKKIAVEMNIPFLGKIPIIPEVVQACDNGKPAINTSEKFKEAMESVFNAIVTDKEKENKNSSVETTNKESFLKIAIPVAQGKLTMHFGHCESFALVDVDESTKKIIKQENVIAPEHQPGLLPKWLHEKGANVIIAGGMGTSAQNLFTKNNIKVIMGAPSEAPEKIVTDYLNDNLVVGGNSCDH